MNESRHSLTSHRTRPIVVRVTLAVAVLAVLVWAVVSFQTGTLLQTATSPDEAWRVEVYLLNLGAMDGGTLRVFAIAREGQQHEIARLTQFENLDFAQEASGEAWPGQLAIEWLDGDRVDIGGYVLALDSDEAFKDF